MIDNEVGGEVEDLRLVKVGDRFAVGYRKYRAIPNRFVNANTRVVMMAPTDAFDEEQLIKLLAAADDIGLDVGEIDVLRDAEDGRVCMIDVNKTPWGPAGRHLRARSESTPLGWWPRPSSDTRASGKRPGPSPVMRLPRAPLRSYNRPRVQPAWKMLSTPWASCWFASPVGR